MTNGQASTVQIVTWFLVITSILGVGARGITKGILVRSVNLDDLLVLLSLVFAIGQSICIWLEARHGFGSSAHPLEGPLMRTDLKYEYSASLLYIACLSCAKASVLSLIIGLSRFKIHRFALFALGGLIVAWTIIAEFGTAFLCHIPDPWNYVQGHCSENDSRRVWWNYLESTNILTDLALIGLPCLVIGKVQIPLARKVSVCLFFAIRSTVVMASICKIVFWNTSGDLYKLHHDPWTVILCTQIIQCLSLLSACFLYLKPFLESLESGFITTDDIRRRGTNAYYSHGSGITSTMRSGLSMKKGARGTSPSIELLNRREPRNLTLATANDPSDSDGQSHLNQPGIIKETRTVIVEGTSASRAMNVV